MQFSKKLTVDGMVNFGALLQAAGFKGTFGLTQCRIRNNAATTLRIIRTSNGTVAPANTDGYGITNETIEWTSASSDAIVQAGQTWLYSAAAIEIEVDLTSN